MTALLLALAAAAASGADVIPAPGGVTTCAVAPLRARGDLQGVPAYVATRVLSVRFRARARLRSPVSGELQLRIYAPNGDLYDVLEVTTVGAGTRRVPRGRPGSPTRNGLLRGEARLPVAGSGIVNSALYGRWTVVPHLGEDQAPCGPSRTFDLRPRVPPPGIDAVVPEDATATASPQPPGGRASREAPRSRGRRPPR